jgi:ABC-type sugar transport system permease subunit
VYERFMRDNPELPDRFKQNFVRFSELLADARFRPVTPAGQLLWDQHVRASERALGHRSTPDEALEVATANVQEQLDSLSAPRRGTPVNWWLVAAIVAMLAVVAFAGARRFAPKSTSRPRGESFWGFLFASPWLIGFAAFTLGPMIASVVYSLCRYDVIHDAEFVGAENYRRLAGDPLFWKSLGNTAFMILGVPLGMAVGLAIAVLLNQNVRGMRGYRTVFYLPAIVPVVASSLLWIWVLNPEVGLLNSLLRMFGADNPPRWLASPSLLLGSKTAILLMGLWGAGASMIVWLAGLKGIPQHLYESAAIDGAGPWRRFWNITLPMLSPYIFFNLVTGVIATMQIFAQAYIMTQGGPDDSTMFYAYYLFNTAFRYFRMGYASAMAWILFFIVLALTLIQLGIGRKWVHYDVT